MTRDINSLLGFKIAASNGELGEVKDFYFDDEKWVIRYLVVDTGIADRKVLIAPEAVESNFRLPGKFKVNLTIEQILNCPDIDTNLPVSRQQREVLHKHHAWENYWESRFFGGGNATDVIAAETEETDEPGVMYDPHLRSAMEVSGYHIHAIGGKIGHVNNFIMDDDTWTLTHFVIDTRNLIGGKKVVVSVEHVDAVQWYNQEVFLDISPEAVEDSPEYHKIEA
jgi:sporulation protein YlmC with PRC-barrel domain